MAVIDDIIDDASPMDRLALTQERMDLEVELNRTEPGVDLAALEADFIKAAGPYAARKGISYAAFRSVGVTPATLKAAGITR